MLKNKLTIALLGAGMALGIGLTIWFAIANPLEQKKISNVTQEQVLKENSEIQKITDMSEEEIEKLSKDEREAYLKGDGKDYEDGQYKISGKDKQEFPQDDSDRFAKELILNAQVANYEKIINAVKDKMENYKFTEGKNLDISSIYYDASVMMTSLTVPEIQKGKVVKDMKNPEMMVIGTIMLPEKSRRDVIYDFESLTPIAEGEVKVLGHELLEIDSEDAYVQSISNVLVGVARVHKVEFSVEGNNLYAYIAEYKNATLQFYGIYSPKDKAYNYKTISFWKEMDRE